MLIFVINQQITVMEIHEVSDNGIKFLIHEEGIILHPYKDSVGIPTIGVGCTYYENGQKVRMTDQPITIERAILLFKNLLKSYELAVYSVTRDDLNHNEFDACTSLTYNIGVGAFKKSTLVSLINKNLTDPNITTAFEAFRNAGGKSILLERRKREAKLYFTPQAAEVFKLTPKLMYDEHIKLIQSKLNLVVDGYFGPKTEQAIRDFQAKNGIIVDGICGPQTMELINKS